MTPDGLLLAIVPATRNPAEQVRLARRWQRSQRHSAELTELIREQMRTRRGDPRSPPMRGY